MVRNQEAIKDLKAKGEAIREPDSTCDQCGKKVEDKLIKETLGGQEKNFCSKDCSKMFKVNLEAQRVISEERATSQIKFLEREIDFKKKQIDSGNITETRAINSVPGQPAIVLDGYIGGKKPAYIIQNEIEKDNQLIKEQKRQIENIKIAREEDASKSS